MIWKKKCIWKVKSDRDVEGLEAAKDNFWNIFHEYASRYV